MQSQLEHDLILLIYRNTVWRCCSTSYSPASPRLTRIIQTVRNIYSVTVEVTLSTGVSCISSVSRGEDNGSDTEDNLDDGQQGRTPPRLSVPCANKPIQTEVHPSFSSLVQSRRSNTLNQYPFLGQGGKWRTRNFLTYINCSSLFIIIIILTNSGRIRRSNHESAASRLFDRDL